MGREVCRSGSVKCIWEIPENKGEKMKTQIQKIWLVMLVIFGGMFVTAATAQIPLQTKILTTAAQLTTDEATQKRITELIAQLGSISNYVRSSAFKALVKIGQPAVQPLSKALGDENVRVRSSAASALGEIGDPQAVQPLKNLLEDEFICIREAAANALEQINRKVAPEEWAKDRNLNEILVL